MKKTFIINILLFLSISLNSFSQFIKIHDFAGGTDGSLPYGSLISDGTFLYGMTIYGGTSNKGTIFKIKLDGTGYVKLYDFTGLNGNSPFGSLYSDGTYMYGMTRTGGLNDLGVIFKIKPDGSGYVKLLDFTGVSNGQNPYGAFISDGTFLYAMTYDGGINGGGIIFKIKTDGSNFVKLLDFIGTTNGKQPDGSLIYDGAYLYGMTQLGGANDLGTIFKIKTDGTGYIKLLDFAGTSNGKNPVGTLISDGTFLYGTTGGGGTNNSGTIFKIMPDGTGYIRLFNFSSAISGSSPYGYLVSDGNFLHGMTYNGGTNNLGTIYKIKPDGSNYIKLLDFAGATNGSQPWGSLFYDGTSMYGMTHFGGINSDGIIFKYGLAIGINELENINQIKIYPNPAHENFTISLNDLMENLHIEIFDMMGEIIYSKKLQSESISLNQPKGIYFVKVSDGEKVFTQKLVIE